MILKNKTFILAGIFFLFSKIGFPELNFFRLLHAFYVFAHIFSITANAKIASSKYKFGCPYRSIISDLWSFFQLGETTISNIPNVKITNHYKEQERRRTLPPGTKSADVGTAYIPV